MKPQKQQSDVRGVQIKCVNFIGCPMCYGCRNYNSADPDCAECTVNRKKNICNTNTHRSDLISKMVLRNRIVVDNIEFKSKQGGNTK